MAKLRVHNIESGPASSDVAFGISGDTIDVSSDSLKLNTWKDSGGNTLFQSDGAGTLSNVNSTFSGGGPKLLATNTITSATSSSEFTSLLNSTYDKYEFWFIYMQPEDTAGRKLVFQCSTDGGSNYNITTTSTAFYAEHSEAGATDFAYLTGSDQAQGTAYQPLSENTGGEADEIVAGYLMLYAPSSTTYVKHYYSRTEAYSQADRIEDTFISGYFNTTSAINAISFKFSSGNINAGKIKMYGVT